MPEKTKTEATYTLINVTRNRHTRRSRLDNGEKRFMLRLGGGEITIRRGRSITVVETMLRRNLAAVKEAVTAKRLEVRTSLQGALVDLGTLKPLAAAAVAPVAAVPASPPPNFQPDSVENDRPAPIRQQVSTNIDNNPSPQATGEELPGLLKDAPPEDAPPPPSEIPPTLPPADQQVPEETSEAPEAPEAPPAEGTSEGEVPQEPEIPEVVELQEPAAPPAPAAAAKAKKKASKKKARRS